MNNQYTLHLLPEPYLLEIVRDTYSHFPNKYPIIGTFTGKEGDILEEWRDFRFQNQYCDPFDGDDWFNFKIEENLKFAKEIGYKTRTVVIPITQSVEEKHKIWSKVLQIYNAKGWSANELYKVLDSKFSITRK